MKKINLEFDWQEFKLDLHSYLFPITKAEKEYGNVSYLQSLRLLQIVTWVLFPITVITSLSHSVRVDVR